MASSQDIEILSCRKTPHGNANLVYLPKILWTGDKENLWFEINEKLSTCGLIYQLYIAHSKIRLSEFYGVVRFYSKTSVKSALSLNKKIIIEDNAIKVVEHKRPDNFKSGRLSLNKAQDLISYYFGFNSWSSKIIYFEREDVFGNASIVRFICVIDIHMTKEDVKSEGIGVGEGEINSDASRGSATIKARRFAYHSAMMDAFSKFVIISLGNGKRAIDVDNTNDDIHMDPSWQNSVKVNELNYNPEFEDFDGLEDISEQELNAMLENSNLTE